MRATAMGYVAAKYHVTSGTSGAETAVDAHLAAMYVLSGHTASRFDTLFKLTGGARPVRLTG